jgi:hypothetical protein
LREACTPDFWSQALLCGQIQLDKLELIGSPRCAIMYSVSLMCFCSHFFRTMFASISRFEIGASQVLLPSSYGHSIAIFLFFSFIPSFFYLSGKFMMFNSILVFAISFVPFVPPVLHENSSDYFTMATACWLFS